MAHQRFLILCQNLGVPKQKATEDTMSDGGLFKAEVIYIRDCEKREAGDMVQQETYTRVSAWAYVLLLLPQCDTHIYSRTNNNIDHKVNLKALYSFSICCTFSA